MASQQTTSLAVPIAVQADPPADDAVPPGGSSIEALLTSNKGSGYLEIYLSSDQTETVSDLRLSLREDGQFAIVAQAGADDRVFASLDLVADKSVKFVVSFAGRPTHAVLSGSFVGVLTATAKRVEN